MTKDAVICDLDGTLALLNGRDPYNASTADEDLINLPILDLIINNKIIFVTGREEKYRPQTEKFLELHGLAPNTMGLYMRKTGDRRKNYIVKEEIYNNYIAPLDINIKFVLEDNEQVVNMWRSLGLVCMKVSYDTIT